MLRVIRNIPCNVVAFQGGTRVVTADYDRTWVVSGKLGEHAPLPAIAGTSLAPGSTYRLHGPGDDLTHAQVDLKFAVTLAAMVDSSM